MTRLAASALAVVALVGAGASSAKAPPAHRYWIVFDSDRDGDVRGYSVRDGSRLTLLRPRTSAQVAGSISRDGTTMTYGDCRWLAEMTSSTRAS